MPEFAPLARLSPAHPCGDKSPDYSPPADSLCGYPGYESIPDRFENQTRRPCLLVSV